MEQKEEIWDKVIEAEQFLAKKISPSQRAELKAFIDNLHDVKRCFRNVETLNTNRQAALEMHCLDREISLEEHEKYHAISDELQAEIKTFFSIYKTSLNSLALLFAAIIPEKQRRGLRLKSFGSLIDSLNKLEDTDGKLGSLIEILSGRGSAIDKRIMSYRNKMIEHQEQLSRGTLSTSGGMSRIIHGKNAELESYPAPQKLNDAQKRKLLSPIKLVMEDSSYVFYYHVKLTVESGTKTNKGESFGTVYDETGIHFNNYGPHVHMFSSNSFKGDVMESVSQSINEVMQSPDPDIAWDELGHLSALILSELGNISKQK